MSVAPSSTLSVVRPPGPTEAMRRELIETKLSEFYAVYCPAKVRSVHILYDSYCNNIPELFDAILAKYPKAPKDSFHDVLQLIQTAMPISSANDSTSTSKALGSSSYTGSVGADAVRQTATVAAVLAEGERLLQSNPRVSHALVFPQIESSMSPQARAASIAYSKQTAAKHDAELDSLNQLIEENLTLAQKIACAELSVLHARFAVILQRCLAPESGLNCDDSTEVLTIISGRTFHIPLSAATWSYVEQGLLKAAIHSHAEKCTIQPSTLFSSAPPPPIRGGGSTDFGTNRANESDRIHAKFEVDVNLLAAAMREWSRQWPHTVSENIAGQWRFYSSNYLWWVWPSVPSRREPVAACSIFSCNESDGSMRDERAFRHFVSHYLDPISTNVVDSSSWSTNLQGADASQRQGYWAYFMDQWDVLVAAGRTNEDGL